MTQIDFELPEAKSSPSKLAGLSSIPGEALGRISDEWRGHIHDLQEHNKEALKNKNSRWSRLLQAGKNLGFAALYTGYFWFDDFPARALTKVSESQVVDMAVVGAASLAVGGVIALTRRHQLQKMYEKLDVEVVDIGPSVSQIANASIMGAPNTVKATAQHEGAHNERPLMNNTAILASAATYAFLQSFTAGPVIDAIDSVMPGGQLSGEIAATSLFVAGAIYTKSLVEVCYDRFKH